jgi:hypothetical protein
MTLVAVVSSVVVTPTWLVLDEFVVDLGAWLPGVSPAITNGLVPFAVLLTAVTGFYAFVKRRFDASNNEAIQALFILLLFAFLVLTVTGIWFRGAGMALVWPWDA